MILAVNSLRRTKKSASAGSRFTSYCQFEDDFMLNRFVFSQTFRVSCFLAIIFFPCFVEAGQLGSGEVGTEDYFCFFMLNDIGKQDISCFNSVGDKIKILAFIEQPLSFDKSSAESSGSLIEFRSIFSFFAEKMGGKSTSEGSANTVKKTDKHFHIFIGFLLGLLGSISGMIFVFYTQRR